MQFFIVTAPSPSLGFAATVLFSVPVVVSRRCVSGITVLYVTFWRLTCSLSLKPLTSTQILFISILFLFYCSDLLDRAYF